MAGKVKAVAQKAQAEKPQDPDLISVAEVSYPQIDELLTGALKKLKMPTDISGATENGWSRMKAFQTCPYYYGVVYAGILGDETPGEDRRDALEIGVLGHAALAVYYTRGFSVPQALRLVDLVKTAGANPTICDEVIRALKGYFLNYKVDYIRPLAAEWVGEDEEGNTCRYDLVLAIDRDQAAIPAGIYAMDHKFKSRFDASAVEWANDGEIIGQINAGSSPAFVEQFGRPLDGAIVNVIGRQKEQRFGRFFVPADPDRHQGHKYDLRYWKSVEMQCRATGVWPRSRAGCIGTFGKCSLYSHCASAGSAR